MNPRHGEIWLVDMGLAGKTRPAVVLLADNLDVPRSLIIYIPITRQNRGSELEVPLGHLPFRSRSPWPTLRELGRFHRFDLKSVSAYCPQRI
jgi:mRNA interferase MazF